MLADFEEEDLQTSIALQHSISEIRCIAISQDMFIRTFVFLRLHVSQLNGFCCADGLVAWS